MVKQDMLVQENIQAPATTIADASKNSRGTEGAAQGDAGAHWGHGMVR